MDQHIGHVHHDYPGNQPNRPAKKSRNAYAHITGWGADLDPENRPAYPMERTPPRLENVHWTIPEEQQSDVKVYHSTERPGLTPVYGTSSPPSGLSGKVRDVAYRFSENDLRHWLLLLFADRVNVVEGIGQDLMSGHMPNVVDELGLRAAWKYNRGGVIRKAAVASAVVGIGYYLLKRKEKSRLY